MTEAGIDYSRPVGWWCTYCDERFPCEPARMWLPMACRHIPVYLPIPEGRRPIVEDEVESAEVCTWDMGGSCCMSGDHSITTVDPVTAWEINYIVTGATE